MKNAIILSAGMGSRMKSDLPKGAFPILYRPMVLYPVEVLHKLGFDKIVVVVGHKKEVIQDILNGLSCEFCEQKELNGTAKAVESAYDILKDVDGETIILPVDMPLITENLVQTLTEFHKDNHNDLTVLSSIVENPFSYGRIVRDKYDNFQCIKEELDTTYEEKQIKEVNSGVYMVNNKLLFEALKQVKNNNKKQEYYLTDIVSILLSMNKKVEACIYKEQIETMGVNDLYSLSIAESLLRKRINKDLMLNGVYIINPDTVTIGPDVVFGTNVVVEPNTYIYGTSEIGSNAHIGPNTEIKNSKVRDGAWVRHSLCYDSIIENNAVVGPFAHLRNNAIVGQNARIGNFVEIKNSSIGKDTKASHLSYIGDAIVGENVNFGAGSITVNYDGKNKWRTTIGNNVFIGSNDTLVAPIVIGDNAITAAGSTIVKNVPEDALAIARPFQAVKPDYARVIIKRNEKRTKSKDRVPSSKEIIK